MKVLVTGATGQLGYDVMKELYARGHECFGSDIAPSWGNSEFTSAGIPYARLDITDPEAVNRLISETKPDAVVHCAAWTAVDLAEEESNIPKVYSVNAHGTRNIALACREMGCKMVYISTDYVFNGKGTRPWDPDCKDYAPLSVYGKSKLRGELAVAEILDKYFIVRIAWAFGKNGNNFINTMLKAGRTHNKLKVVSDQIGTPTYTFDLSKLLADMIETEEYGYYHATNEGEYISWYDFAKEIFSQAVKLGYSEYGPHRLMVEPVTTEEYGVSKAKRPFNSRLDKSKLARRGFTPLPTWKDALERYLKEIKF